MANITGLQITELAEAVVSFDAPVDVSQMSSGQFWDMEPVDPGSIHTSIYDAEVLGGFQLVKIWFSPWISPNQDYTITAYPGGVATSVTFTAPNLLKELGSEWNHGLLRAISRSAGQLIQEFVGKPETILVKDLMPGDRHIFVESTLGFPQSGYVLIGDREYKYESKKPSSFRYITADETVFVTNTARQRVVVHTAKILPPNGSFHLDASGDGTDGVI